MSDAASQSQPEAPRLTASAGSDQSPQEGQGSGASPQALYADGTTRVDQSRPFDRWYYSIEDVLGQGTVGMGVGLIAFALMMVFAFCVRPI